MNHTHEMQRTEGNEIISTDKSHHIKNMLAWEWVVEPGQYADLHFVDAELLAVKNSLGKYGVIDTKGELVINFEYDGIAKFNDDVALVSRNGEYWYIDKNGLPIIENKYQDGNNFSESLGAVKQNNMWGFIDLLGNVSIEYQFEEIKPFIESRAAVKIDSKWGYVDKSGEVLVWPQFDQVNNFREGIAAIRFGDKWGFVNSRGDIIVNFQYDEVYDFHESYAAVMKDEKWGFIDKKGNVVIDLKYDAVGNFSENKASVKLSNYIEGMDAWAYVDENDEIVVDFYPYSAAGGRMIYVGEFKEGIAFVSKDLYCIIDAEGNNILLGDSVYFISSLLYESEYDVIPGYVFIDDKMTIRKYGFMGLTGEQRIEPIFDFVSEIEGEFVIVENIIDNEYKKGIIRLIP
jgi:hypothetical protein